MIKRTLPSVASLTLAVASTLAQSLPPGFTIDTIATWPNHRPTDCAFLPDGRCLVSGQAGAIRIVAGNNSALVGSIPNVQFGGERGLLSIVAAPDFAQTGHIYVWYSDTLDAFMHLDRFQCNGDLANPTSTNVVLDTASRRIVLGDLPDTASNHNGGSLRFGPDGLLFLTVGDDSYGCLAQDVASKCGCLLRMNVSSLSGAPGTGLPAYSSLDPGDNPLSANLDFTQLVVAFGLRNPFRMEIDPVTGSLYIGDVGHDDEEEISEYPYELLWPRATRGSVRALVNFGWPFREGSLAGPFAVTQYCTTGPLPGAVQPIAVMPRTVVQQSIIVGSRYRNQGGTFDFGPVYEGSLFFADLFTGQIRRLVKNASWQPGSPVPGQPTSVNWGTGFGGATFLRQGPDGALWVSSLWNGTLSRIRPILPRASLVVASGNGQRAAAGEAIPQPVVVRATDALNNPLVGTPVHFAVAGAAQLSTTNPVMTNAAGLASTMVVTQAGGGAIAVTALVTGGLTTTTANLYARAVVGIRAGSYLAVSVLNETDALPPLVPYVLLMSFPGSPTLPTVLGPLCIDPGYALAMVLEDGTGLFGGVSFSGSGGIGSPLLTRLYALPGGIFAGQSMSLQAVGLDSLSGWFRTSCSSVAF